MLFWAARRARLLHAGLGYRPVAPLGPLLAAALLGSHALLKPKAGQQLAWAWLALAAGVAGMLMTGTRGLLPLCLGLVAAPLWQALRWATPTGRVGAGVLAFLAAVLAVLGPARQTLQRLLALPVPGAQAGAGQSLERRLWLARPVWALIQRRPVWGFGAGELATQFNSPDVGILNLLLFGGWMLAGCLVLGLVAWAWLHWPRRWQVLHVHVLLIALGFAVMQGHTNMLLAGPTPLATVVLACATFAAMLCPKPQTEAARQVAC